MATVLEERPGSKEAQVENGSADSWEGRVQKDRILLGSVAGNLRNEERPKEYEIIFPVGDGQVSQKTFDFVIQTATKFSGTLVLLYMTKSPKVPSNFVDYAKSERIQDYVSHYHDFLLSAKLGTLGSKAEDAKIKWRGRLHLGGIRDALKSYSGNKNAIVVLDGSMKGIGNSNWLGRLTLSKKPEAELPILLI